MTQMKIDEIHAVNLDILKHLDAFCKAHGIRYWLSSGSCLGAVRHHGFIPWDDDADVSMPRPDYERFLKEYVDSDEYHFFAPEKCDSFLTYGRLCEMKRTFFKPCAPWTPAEYVSGIGVDIFPMDGTDDDEAKYRAVADDCRRLRERIIHERGWLNHQVYRRDVWGFCKDVVHGAVRVWRRFGAVLRIRRMLDLFRQKATARNYDESTTCDELCCIGNPNAHPYKTECFRDVEYVEYCDTLLPIPKGYDAYLKKCYGDYMTPPPPEKRGGHTYQTMYWRDK